MTPIQFIEVKQQLRHTQESNFASKSKLASLITEYNEVYKLMEDNLSLGTEIKPWIIYNKAYKVWKCSVFVSTSERVFRKPNKPNHYR